MKLKKITDVFVRKLSPKNVAYDEPLGNSLYITVRPNGRKIFFLRYTVNEKRTKHKLGEYPFYTLAQAMLDAQNQKNQAQTIGNLHTAKQEKIRKDNTLLEINKKSNFKILINNYVTMMHDSKKWSDKTRKDQELRIAKYLEPCFFEKSINIITIDDINNCFKEIMKKPQLCKKVSRILYNLYEYADILGLLEEKNTIILSRIKRLTKTLPKIVEKSRYQALSDDEIAKLMSNIKGINNHSLQVRSALNLAPYVALRPSELCSLEWENINFPKKQILIPSKKMKMERDHIVPLSTQAQKILMKLKDHQGESNYVFYSKGTRSGHIAPESVRKALRSLGYTSATQDKNNFTTHGFRGLFSTIAHQHLNFSSEIIEFQLSHVEKNKVKAAYNQLDTFSYLNERTKLMQEYANYLDKLMQK